MILCHQPTRLKDDYGLVLPSLKSIIELHEGVVKFFRDTKVIAIGLNSVGLSDERSQEAADRITQETGLPAIDAFRFSSKKLTDAILNFFTARDH